ncbi:MAG: patatin-like phospholipase family protein [Pelolinea sp.]|nr:patatin-like phospholipase family protein [Pelolinea sp.]
MKKITLALGGGGTKGFAHIGVIQQLETFGFEPSAIAGTSAGGLVGALYASGYSSTEIGSFANSLNYSKLFTRAANDLPSLLGLGGLYELLKKYLGDMTFADTKIPFAVTAVDRNSGIEYIINTGKLTDAVKATTAVPGIFPPFILGKKTLVDGGVLNPVPVSIARWLKYDVPVLAVSLTAPPEKWSSLPKYEVPSFVPVPHFVIEQLSQLRLSKAVESFVDSLELMVNQIAWLRLKEEKPDVLINPSIYKYSMIDDINVNEAIELGKNSVIEKFDDISKAYSISNKLGRWIRASKPPAKLLDLSAPTLNE